VATSGADGYLEASVDLVACPHNVAGEVRDHSDGADDAVVVQVVVAAAADVVASDGES